MSGTEPGIDAIVAEVIEHGAKSPRWRGNPRQYQIEAQARYAAHFDRSVLPWSWVTTECEADQCLIPECMTLHAARKIQYPADICVYCGEGGYTKDHLLPEPLTGKAVRHLVAVVPACGSCNSRIGDYPSANVADRRRLAQIRLERANRRLLLRPIKGPEELRELTHTMRTVAVKNNVATERVRARLAWPIDPFYDIRAFQRSGIEDPVALGLCDAVATPLRPEYLEESA